MKKKSRTKFNFASPKSVLTEREIELLSRQIRYNSKAMDHFIDVIDLLVNKEKCPKDANTLAWLRKRLAISIEENDTFRKVLWRHQKTVSRNSGEDPATSFLIHQIKTRRQSLIAQAAMK